jgi:dsDNA-specific endonuclease/ATPase MutS2
LVSVGFFHPQAPNPSRIGDPRVVVSAPAIWQSQLDFIDLHAENLLPGYQHMDANDILYRQISHFKNFLEKAIKYNLHKIYVVHGIGKGVLKAEIEKVLKKYPEVSSYNNDYHTRFGFGATEIFLD